MRYSNVEDNHSESLIEPEQSVTTEKAQPRILLPERVSERDSATTVNYGEQPSDDNVKIRMDDAPTSRNLYKEQFKGILTEGSRSNVNSAKKNHLRRETSMLKPKRKYMDKVEAESVERKLLRR